MNDDNDLKEIFSRARMADRAEVPRFDTLMHNNGPSVPSARLRRLLPLLPLAAVGSAGILAVVLLFPRIKSPDAIAPLAKSDVTTRPAMQSPPPQAEQSAELEPDVIDHVLSLGYIGAAGRINGEAAETIVAESRSTIVDTEDAKAPNSFNSEFIEGLPIIGSNYQAILTLAPGVTDTDGDGNPNVHGSRDTGLQYRLGPQYRLDGGNITDPASGTFGQNLNPDIIEDRAFNTESYTPLAESAFQRVQENPVSTFAVDVDTASYSVVRRFLMAGQLPPADAVRLEELINYFPYHDPAPTGSEPFSVQAEIADCPWNPEHTLARISLRGLDISRTDLPGSNLVFLLDVSGSMDQPAKLPLVKSALTQLVSQLDGRDNVAIVVYAGSSGLVLPPTSGSAKSEILEALDTLSAGGSTNGGEGLQLAYRIARERLVSGGINRVILATDGDFNVGITDRGELVRFVEDQAHAGVSLTVLGFGMGNYKDDTLEMLADRGNGNYAYIDTPQEARKVLVEQIGGTLMTIAKDVKIQVEFNPVEVGAYRLIGYENRMLRREDFNDDRKDAGEIGAGHSVTVLYELLPPGRHPDTPDVDALKYQSGGGTTSAAVGGESFTVKLRYKEPDGEVSRLLVRSVTDTGQPLSAASADLRFAAAVAGFGMMLRHSENSGNASYPMVLALAQDSLGDDQGGYRAEFVRLVLTAMAISNKR